MDKLNMKSGKDAFMKGLSSMQSKVRGPNAREQGKFQFDIKILNVENLPITGTVLVSWKRGTKSSNNGKTKPVTISPNKSASFNHPFSLTTTLYKDKPPKKTYESKTIAVSIKDEKTKKSIAKTMLDLADFTQNLRDEQFKSIPIKQKKGGPIVLTLNVKTKELEINPDDEPATETDLNSNDGSDDEDGEDFVQDDDSNSDISTASSTSKFGNRQDDHQNMMNDLLGGGSNNNSKPASPGELNDLLSNKKSPALNSYNSTSSKESTPVKSNYSAAASGVKPFSNDQDAELNALLSKGPSKPVTSNVSKPTATSSTLTSTSSSYNPNKDRDYKREADEANHRVMQLERQVEMLQKDLKNGGGNSGSSGPSAQEFADLKKRFREISGDNIDLEDKVKDLEDKLANANKQAVASGSVSKQVSELQEQLRQKDSTIQDLNLKNRRLERDLEDKDQELADQGEQVKYYQSQLKTSQQQTQQAMAAAAASSSGSGSNSKDQEEIEYLKREIQVLKESQSQSNTNVGGGTLELKRKIQDLTREVKEKDDIINKMKSGNSPSISSPASTSSASSASTNITINNLEKQNADLNKTIQQQKQELEKSKQEIQQLQQQQRSSPVSKSSSPVTGDESIKRENIDLKDKITVLQTDLKRLQDKHDQLNRRYNDDIEEHNNIVNDLREREESLHRKVNELQDANQQMENKMSMSMTSAAALSMTSVGASKYSKDKSSEKDKQEREQLERQLEQTKLDLSRERERTKKLEREIKDLKDRIRSLEDQLESGGHSNGFTSTVAKSDNQERDENRVIEQSIYTQSMTFRDGVGATASSLFEKLSDLNAFSSENGRLFNKVHSALSQQVEKSMYNSSDLAYWLSNISGLIHLIKDGPNNIDDDHDPIIDGVLIMDNNSSPSMNSRKSPSQTFYYQLINLCRETYSLLLHNIYNKLRPKLTNIITQGTCILDKKTFSAIENEGDINKICKLLQKYMNFLRDRFVFDSIVQQFFSQTFHFISYTLLNDILGSDKYCNSSNGFKLKLSCSKIDDWISSSEEKDLLEPARHHFMAIIEAANLMVIDKSIFTDSDSILQAFEALNILQIKKLLEVWKPDNLSPDPIPMSVMQMSRSNWNRPTHNLILQIDPTILLDIKPTL